MAARFHFSALAALLTCFIGSMAGCNGCLDTSLAGDTDESDTSNDDVDVSRDEIEAEPGDDPEADFSVDTEEEDGAADDSAEEDMAADELEEPDPGYWAKTFGLGGDELACCIDRTQGGRLIVAGGTDRGPVGDHALWFLELDGQGNVVFEHARGGEIGGRPRALGRTQEGSHLLTGWIVSTGPGYYDVFAMQLGSMLEPAWQNVIGSPASDYAESIEPTQDHGTIIAGYSTGSARRWDLTLRKTDSSGALVWQEKYCGDLDDFAMAAFQKPDGGYIVAGGTYSWGEGGGDIWLLRVDGLGEIMWQKTIGGRGYDQISDFQKTDDGSYILAGETRSLAGEKSHVFVAKVNDAGVIEWQKAYAGEDYEVAYGIRQISDHGYILAGDLSPSEGEECDGLVMRLDAGGSVVWQKTFGGDDNDRLRSVVQTADHGFAAAGYTESFGEGTTDFWVLKMDGEGAISDTCPAGMGEDASLETVDTAFVASPSSAEPCRLNDSEEDLAFDSLDSDAAEGTQCER